LEPTPVALVGVPAFLRAIVEDVVARDPELEFVGEFESQGAALQRIDRGLDVVVVTNVDRAGMRSLLSARPRWRVLALFADGHGVLYEPLAQPRMLADLSPEALRTVLRPRGGDGEEQGGGGASRSGGRRGRRGDEGDCRRDD
jgi:hypothetical protein